MAISGDNILITNADGGLVAVDTKTPDVGHRVILMKSADGETIAVKALNVYEQDDGLMITLPCGSKTFLASEPPDYFKSTPLNISGQGMGCNCSQGAPETNGWICAADCGFRTELGICKISLGYAQNIYDPNFCTHVIGRNHWYGNEYIKEIPRNYGCARNSQYCPYYYLGWDDEKKIHKYCPDVLNANGTVILDETGAIVSDTRKGCAHTDRLVVMVESRIMGYACSRKSTCPYYNGGAGTKMCTYGPSSAPPFQPGGKPPANICQNPAGLSFTGWEVPGGENSNEIRCAFSKATEGNSGSVNASSGFGDDQIRCQFSVF